jgi:hypothetical protein
MPKPEKADGLFQALESQYLLTLSAISAFLLEKHAYKQVETMHGFFDIRSLPAFSMAAEMAVYVVVGPTP